MKTSELKQIIRELIFEGSAAKLYKIEGLLITSTKDKTQTQIMSDIRAVTGVTTIDTNAYIPKLPKKGRKYDKVTIKIDPYPYLRHNKTFNIDTIAQIIQNIKNVKGVITFKTEPQLINIGV